MTAVLVAIVAALALALALTGVLIWQRHAGHHPAAHGPEPGAPRILFPFVASALSRRALDAALRLARAEDATLVPVFLASVPLHLPLDSALPRQAATAIPLQEAVEQRAAAYAVPVDSRLERGRTYRHALRQAIANESFDRIVIAAAIHGAHGFLPDDVAWLLDHASGEILVLRPARDDEIVPQAPPRPYRASANGRRSSGVLRRDPVRT